MTRPDKHAARFGWDCDVPPTDPGGVLELTACPRCGGEVYWVKLFDDRDELFAMCSQCTWGED